ncbi:MAG TPA: hypothetical protein PK388_02575 [Kiritimatiellia bacterium]|nr:hypothetical protein [Kiritimatiellia bacterium]
MRSSIRRYLLASIAGWGGGILLFIIIAIYSNVSPDGLVKKFLLIPFSAINYPLIDLGAMLFGQNPIFVLPFMGMCWGFLGLIVVLLSMAIASSAKRLR